MGAVELGLEEEVHAPVREDLLVERGQRVRGRLEHARRLLRQRRDQRRVVLQLHRAPDRD